MDYYHKKFQSYFHDTVHVDSTPFLEPVVKHLPPGGEVWDVGCGSGRDLLWLKQRGFKVVGLERSQGLTRLAAAHSGCQVIQGDFNTFDFSQVSVDAPFDRCSCSCFLAGTTPSFDNNYSWSETRRHTLPFLETGEWYSGG